MAKCAICKGKIETTFLEKIRGTYMNKKAVCNKCQKKFSAEELKKKLPR